jgi:hypothetical protein
MRRSAHAEGAALRWEESVTPAAGEPGPRVPVARRPGPPPSAIAEGAAIRRLEADDAEPSGAR